MARCAILGLGSVGRALLGLLNEKGMSVAGEKIVIAAAADSKGALISEVGIDASSVIEAKKGGRMFELQGWKDGATAEYVAEMSDYDILIDCMPTNFEDISLSLNCCLAAIERGKHTVTANKGPLSMQMRKLLKEAECRGAGLMFSATVGGGTPFLEFGRLCAQMGQVVKIRGVLNGTSNFIITRMSEGVPMGEAIREAREMGIAESRIVYDTEGLDSAAKLVILANWVMDADLRLDEVEREGIDRREQEIMGGAASGRAPRLVASYDCVECHPSVRLEMISPLDPLNVSGVLNSVSFIMEEGYEYTLTGGGAGGRSTASAIIRDVERLIGRGRDAKET